MSVIVGRTDWNDSFVFTIHGEIEFTSSQLENTLSKIMKIQIENNTLKFYSKDKVKKVGKNREN